MTSKPKSSREIPGPAPRKDKEREMRKAVVKDADKTGDDTRDLVHGDGASVGLPVGPDEIGHDD